MKSLKKFSGLMIAMLLLCMSLTVSAFAAEAPVFQDVAADSPWLEGITYAAENGITSGTGNGCFSPDQNISVRQWAVMICRAYSKEVEADPDSAFGTAEMKLAYREGWLDVGAMVDPDSAMCRRYTYESIFHVEKIPVFSSELYAEDTVSAENRFVKVAKENAMCDENANGLDLITRGEAVQIIYMMQTKEIKVETPSLMEMINLVNADGVHNLNAFLMEVKKIPESILYEFQADGWSYRVDSEYVDDFGASKGTQYAGCCSYRNKSIYVKFDYATVHEFGHYYHEIIDASDFDDIFEKEAEAARAVLGDYATTNEYEYFAETFDYWINWSENQSKMSTLKEAAPETFAFFNKLAMGNWQRAA